MKNTKLCCRACGYPVVDEDIAIEAAANEYNLPIEVIAESVRVWHPDCAVADGQIDEPSEAEGGESGFYWDIPGSVFGRK
ncbi:MAG: hypothetical protein KatS3mg051_2040 [Anaerolineae bacterium]|nr:MAG: hypothetical protein KatS3mg051_2040 [Anaerolineae bacterium]